MNVASPLSHRRAARRPPPSLPLYVFIAYGDVAAARDAVERVKRLLGDTRPNGHIQPMLWRFDQLRKPMWREMALHDASRAHAIVLAMGNAPSLDAATDEWLTALTHRQAGAPITCVALMRDNEAWTISLQRTEVRAPAAASPLTNGSIRQSKPSMTARAA